MQEKAEGVASPPDKTVPKAGIVVCVDLEGDTDRMVGPGRILAKALGAELSFIHVIETSRPAPERPVDPVEWEIKRRETSSQIARLAGDGPTGPSGIHVLEGRIVEQIASMLAERRQDILVIGRGHEDGWGLGPNSRQLLNRAINAVLLVPDEGEPKERFSRLVVPIDCSGRSENVMAFVEAIARSEAAEVILLHALPPTVLVGGAPIEPHEADLKIQLQQRNARVARAHLEEMTRRLGEIGVKVSFQVLEGDDVRRQLLAATDREKGDLLVVGSHGLSGFSDVPYGDVASFLIQRSRIPVLLLRHGGCSLQEHAFTGANHAGLRGHGASVNDPSQ